MTGSSAPPSRPSRPSGGRPGGGEPARGKADAREWLGGIRVSGFMVVMLGLVVLGAFVLVPTFGNFVEQRQRIAALERQVEATSEEVAELREQRERLDDPAYITAQARQRLHYVYPGEVVYLIDDDLPAAEQPVDDAPISDEVTETDIDWMPRMLAGLVRAGLAETVSEPPPAPSPAPSP